MVDLRGCVAHRGGEGHICFVCGACLAHPASGAAHEDVEGEGMMAVMSDASGWTQERVWLAVALTIGAAIVLLWSLHVPVGAPGARHSKETTLMRSGGTADADRALEGAASGSREASVLMTDEVASALEIASTSVPVDERGAT